MQVMLPPQNGVKPHVTGEFGEHRAHKPHGGTDFNYVGASTAVICSTRPSTRRSRNGDVRRWRLRHGEDQGCTGHSHEILHLHSTQVKEGQPIKAGEPIGTMGGRGPGGAGSMPTCITS